MMILADLQKELEKRFSDAGFESPDIETAYLLEEVTGFRHNLLWMHKEHRLTPEEMEKAERYLVRRLADEPFQYICGWTQFRELELTVSSACLIPRPETEFLVDHILKHLPPFGIALELGTGSGAIALSLGYERRDARVWASDISPDALAVAEQNRLRHALNNVTLLAGDLFAPFPAGLKSDVLAANLPYIPRSAEPDLPANVRDHEPALALFADDSGMALIKRALREAPPYLKPGAYLFFEMGPEQTGPLSDFAAETGYYTDITILADQYGEKRFLQCNFSENDL